MVDGGELPQWVSYVGGAVGIIIATVAVRLGWQSKSAEAAGTPEPGRLIGALVDSGSVKDLSLAIEANTETSKAFAEVLETGSRELRDEMRNLGDEIRRLGNKLDK